ncbi:hypothetical protein EB061_12290 [bacterium]|nr:hypothetical protein [bacterium]
MFADGQGRMLFLNELLLPRSFRGHLLELNAAWPMPLEELQASSREAPVCFRDSASRGFRSLNIKPSG